MVIAIFTKSYLTNFFTLIADKNKNLLDEQLISRIRPYITARIDIKLITNVGDLQISFVSDCKAKINKPAFLNKDGIGYVINSYVGRLEFVAKATVDGQIQLYLRGNDVRDPDNNSKLIPYWIDYTKLVINEQTIFDTLTPVWHDKPYKYNMEVNADEEITFQVEWFPHRSDTDTAGEITRLQLSSEKKLKEKINTLSKRTLELEKNNFNLAQMLHKFAPYFTARIDLKLIPKTGGGDFQILSLSDNNAKATKPAFMNKDGIGYKINSYVGKLEIVAKATVDGQIRLILRGSDVRDPKNKAKKIPYWIDYTALVVNRQTILDTLTPTWHNKLYKYNMDVKADEEITFQVEWLPHRSDT